jgi:hypothetical protein
MSPTEEPRTFSDFTDEEREAFYDLADRFIDLANEAAHDCAAGPRRVSAAMMYATARYNAYIAHLGGFQGGDAEVADVVGYYVEQYQTVLREHLNDALVKRQD